MMVQDICIFVCFPESVACINIIDVIKYMCIAEEPCQLTAPSQALEEFQTLVAPIVDRLQGAEISVNDSRMT